MSVNIGTDGRIEVYEHFLGYAGPTVNTVIAQVSGAVNYCSVNEGSFALTTDEPGGILKLTMDTANNDNVFLFIGPFKPADGGVWMEARFKIDDITTSAMLVGFQETLNATTPVMAAEFATETMTYNASCGNFVGLQFDSSGTTDDWRMVGGDAAAGAWIADSDSSRVYQPPVNNEFDVVRVEINTSGDVDIYLAASSYSGSLRLVKHAEGVVNPADVINAVIEMEDRDASGASVFEVDYFNAGGHIDWTQ